jgi:hypothetical protein
MNIRRCGKLADCLTNMNVGRTVPYSTWLSANRRDRTFAVALKKLTRIVWEGHRQREQLDGDVEVN